MDALTFYLNFGRFSKWFIRQATWTRDRLITVIDDEGDPHDYIVKGRPLDNCVDLAAAYAEDQQTAKYPQTLNAYLLRCIENHELATLVVGFDMFDKAIEFAISKALFEGVRVKVCDQTTHETRVFEPLMPKTIQPWSHRIPRRKFAPLPPEKQDRPGRTRLHVVTVEDFPSLQWDTLVRDRNGGRTETTLRPELAYLRKWARENREWNQRLRDVQEEDRMLREYQRELEMVYDCLDRPRIQKFWTACVRYALNQNQRVFEEAGIRPGDPLTRECLPLLQCLYECEPTYDMTFGEEELQFMNLVWYVAHGFRPTCYPHETKSQKKWALEASKDDEQEVAEEVADEESGLEQEEADEEVSYVLS